MGPGRRHEEGVEELKGGLERGLRRRSRPMLAFAPASPGARAARLTSGAASTQAIHLTRRPCAQSIGDGMATALDTRRGAMRTEPPSSLDSMHKPKA